MEELGRKSVNEFKQSDKFPIMLYWKISAALIMWAVFFVPAMLLIEAIYIDYSAKPPHKEIKKTALGAEESVSWKYFKTSAEAIDELKIRKYKVYAVEQAEESYELHSANFRQNEKIAVVFGNEVTGIEQSTIHLCDGCIEIPQLGMKHSLNIATAAGIVLWELIRSKMPPAVKEELNINWLK
jgi:tRNA G18 (ribose-2'-O)-methylase SpoU